MSKPILTRNPAPSDGQLVPTSLPLEQFVEAMWPVFALLGLEPGDVTAEGFSVTEEAIEFRSVLPIVGVDPVPSSDDPLSSIWVWPMRVEVTRP